MSFLLKYENLLMNDKANPIKAKRQYETITNTLAKL